jgi:hypothetical protein
MDNNKQQAVQEFAKAIHCAHGKIAHSDGRITIDDILSELRPQLSAEEFQLLQSIFEQLP